MAAQTRNRLLNLQALRALAALLVVYVHAEDILYRIPGYALPAIGHGGVDLFFVISGFVMVLTTAGQDVSPGGFLWRRFARVAPLYWLVTLFVFTLALFAPAIFKGTQADVGELVKSLLFIPYLKGSGQVAPIVFVGWTLNLEMAFYALLAAALFASRRFAYVLAIGALVAVSLAGLTSPADPVARFYSTTMLAEFGLGMLLALAWNALSTATTPWLKAAAVFSLLVGVPLLIASPSVGTAPLRLVTAGLPSVLIVAGAVALDRWGMGWRNRAAQVLGDASYSIYLTHFFVVGAAVQLAKKLGVNGLPALALFLACVAVVIVVGVLVHRYVERPITRFAAVLGQRGHASMSAARLARSQP